MTNLGRHLLNVLLVMLLIQRSLREADWVNPTFVAIAVGLVWAIHPINLDAVAYITQRTEMMFAFG